MDEQCFDKTYGDAKGVGSGSPCPPSAGRPKCGTFGLAACGVPGSVFDRANRLTEQALDETFEEGLDIGRAEGIAEMRGRIATEVDGMIMELAVLADAPAPSPDEADLRDSVVDAIARILTIFENL